MIASREFWQRTLTGEFDPTKGGAEEIDQLVREVKDEDQFLDFKAARPPASALRPRSSRPPTT